jgi:hypothetical protein
MITWSRTASRMQTGRKHCWQLLMSISERIFEISNFDQICRTHIITVLSVGMSSDKDSSSAKSICWIQAHTRSLTVANARSVDMPSVHQSGTETLRLHIYRAITRVETAVSEMTDRIFISVTRLTAGIRAGTVLHSRVWATPVVCCSLTGRKFPCRYLSQTD